jgi:hypothetical protein
MNFVRSVLGIVSGRGRGPAPRLESPGEQHLQTTPEGSFKDVSDDGEGSSANTGAVARSLQTAQQKSYDTGHEASATSYQQRSRKQKAPPEEKDVGDDFDDDGESSDAGTNTVVRPPQPVQQTSRRTGHGGSSTLLYQQRLKTREAPLEEEKKKKRAPPSGRQIWSCVDYAVVGNVNEYLENNPGKEFPVIIRDCTLPMMHFLTLGVSQERYKRQGDWVPSAFFYQAHGGNTSKIGGSKEKACRAVYAVCKDQGYDSTQRGRYDLTSGDKKNWNRSFTPLQVLVEVMGYPPEEVAAMVEEYNTKTVPVAASKKRLRIATESGCEKRRPASGGKAPRSGAKGAHDEAPIGRRPVQGDATRSITLLLGVTAEPKVTEGAGAFSTACGGFISTTQPFSTDQRTTSAAFMAVEETPMSDRAEERRTSQQDRGKTATAYQEDPQKDEEVRVMGTTQPPQEGSGTMMMMPPPTNSELLPSKEHTMSKEVMIEEWEAFQKFKKARHHTEAPVANFEQYPPTQRSIEKEEAACKASTISGIELSSSLQRSYSKGRAEGKTDAQSATCTRIHLVIPGMSRAYLAENGRTAMLELLGPVQGAPLRGAAELIPSILGGTVRSLEVAHDSLFVEFYITPPAMVAKWQSYFDRPHSAMLVNGRRVGIMVGSTILVGSASRQ